MHYGDGAYQDTERESQALLGVERPLVEPLRPDDDDGVLLPAQTAAQPRAFPVPYEAGGVPAVLAGRREVRAGGRGLRVDGRGCYPLVEHPYDTADVLDLEVGPGVTWHLTCFTPGIAPPGAGGP